jgi:hypothetical protein
MWDGTFHVGSLAIAAGGHEIDGIGKLGRANK